MLESRQMGGAFQLLRTYDLLWSPSIATYLKGERTGVNDLMAWNADGTRMAYRMHTDYLHQLYLNNDLAEGRYVALGETLDLADVDRADVRRRHRDRPRRAVASVYKVGKLVRSKRLHVLPDERRPQRRHHQRAAASEAPPSRAARRRPARDCRRRTQYLKKVEPAQGSWWPTFAAWLAEHSTKTKVAPPKMGAAGLQAGVRCAGRVRARSLDVAVTDCSARRNPHRVDARAIR